MIIRLTLRIVEVGGHSDDGLGDRLTQVVFRRLFHLLQHTRRDFRRSHLFAVDFDPGVTVVRLDDLVGHQADVLLDFRVLEATADEALDRVEGIGRVGDSLAFGGLTDQYFVAAAKSHDGRRGAVTFAVFDDTRFTAFHDRDAGVGGPQVNSDNFAHCIQSPRSKVPQ